MGRKKGSKNKTKGRAKSAKQTPIQAPKPVLARSVDPNIGLGQHNVVEDSDYLEVSREALYAECDAANGVESESEPDPEPEPEPDLGVEDQIEPPVEPTDVPPVEELAGEFVEPDMTPEPPVEPTDVPPVEELAEPPTDLEGSSDELELDETEIDKTKDKRTVSLNALHEERKKRQAAQAHIKTLEASVEAHRIQLEEMDGRFKKIEENKQDEFLSDEDKKEREVERRMDALEAENTKNTQEQEVQTREAQKQAILRQVEDVDKKLAAEGLPGFQFLKSKVQDVLAEIAAKDPVQYVALDNPKGWEEIYRKRVFPAFRGILQTKEKSEIMAEKEAKKAQANLAGSPGKDGKPPEKKKEEKEHSFDDYMAGRAAGSPV